jgi:hypothetical protein
LHKGDLTAAELLVGEYLRHRSRSFLVAETSDTATASSDSYCFDTFSKVVAVEITDNAHRGVIGPVTEDESPATQHAVMHALSDAVEHRGRVQIGDGLEAF